MITNLLTKYILASIWTRIMIFLIFYFIIIKIHCFDVDFNVVECMQKANHLKKAREAEHMRHLLQNRYYMEEIEKKVSDSFRAEVPLQPAWQEVDEPLYKLAFNSKKEALFHTRSAKLNQNTQAGIGPSLQAAWKKNLQETIEDYMRQTLPIKQLHQQALEENQKLHLTLNTLETKFKALQENLNLAEKKSLQDTTSRLEENETLINEYRQSRDGYKQAYKKLSKRLENALVSNKMLEDQLTILREDNPKTFYINADLADENTAIMIELNQTRNLVKAQEATIINLKEATRDLQSKILIEKNLRCNMEQEAKDLHTKLILQKEHFVRNLKETQSDLVKIKTFTMEVSQYVDFYKNEFSQTTNELTEIVKITEETYQNFIYNKPQMIDKATQTPDFAIGAQLRNPFLPSRK